MCPPKACCIDEISDLWTDQQIFSCIKSIHGGSSGASLPPNVVADVNPYLYEPSNLPEGIWFIVRSDDPKRAEVGRWKARGDPCHIYTDSSIIGWRTTLEFFKGLSPNDHLTNWLMQEYSISGNVSSNIKGGTSLCRVFHSEREGGTKANDDPKGKIILFPDNDNKSANDKPVNGKLQEELDRYKVMMPEDDHRLIAECFEDGDFLEMKDLEDPQTSSSSSNSNSSCVTPSSDLYFDSVALLQELENEVTDASSYRFSVSRPNDTVVTIVAEELPIAGNNVATEPVKVEASNGGGASSSRQTPRRDKGKKVYGKLIRKFFCFLS